MDEWSQLQQWSEMHADEEMYMDDSWIEGYIWKNGTMEMMDMYMEINVYVGMDGQIESAQIGGQTDRHEKYSDFVNASRVDVLRLL